MDGIGIEEIKTPAEVFEDLYKKSYLDPRKDIPSDVCIFQILDYGKRLDLFTKGNFSCITGLAKAGKSFLVSMFAAAMIKGGKLMDKLYAPNFQKLAYFDTEQSEYHAQKVQGRIWQMAGEIENLRMHLLRSCDVTGDRLDFIGWYLYKYKPEVVVIDGIVDLIDNLNSEEQATMICGKLMKWTADLKIHIITILHQNKTDMKATGHIGSAIMKKAEAVISVKREAGQMIVEPQFVRNRTFNDFCFVIDEHGIPVIGEYVKQESFI